MRFPLLLLLYVPVAVAPRAQASKPGDDQARRAAEWQAAGLSEPLVPVPFTQVSIDDRFWRPRLDTNRKVTLEACLKQCEATGRIRNFVVAGKQVEGQHQGALYNDSDVYKVLEGAAYCLRLEREEALEQRIDAIVDQIAAAQQPDGYLNTYYTLVEPDKRWTNIRHGHELYCAGHLIEAAVAYDQATGKHKLLDVARKLADLIEREFGPGRRLDPPGHPELELALMKLWRHTGDERHAKLAQFFIDQRGNAQGRERFGEYCQDHQPLREQREAVGHAVRAMYLYSGAADVAAQTRDVSLMRPLEAIWKDLTGTKMYLTGGIGNSAANEGFTQAYDLPNDTAYCETCAAIGMALWSHRMCLLTREARYADVLETELYNNILAGVSLGGDRFFYDNPLATRGDHHRVPWFDCACCPSNLVRYLPALGERVYASAPGELYVLLYVAGRAEVRVDGAKVVVRQETVYPWEGRVKLTLEPERELDFTLHLRAPGWARGAGRIAFKSGETIGRPDPGSSPQGWHVLRRIWKKGDVVELSIPMEPQIVPADPNVQAQRGRAALRRGPVVYAFEAVDNGGYARNLVLPAGARMSLVTSPAELGPGPMILAPGYAVQLKHGADVAGTRNLLAVPYCLWDNRKPGEMVVWAPQNVMLAELPGEGPRLAQNGVELKASHCWRGDTLLALNDGLLPKRSNDESIPRATFWDHLGTQEWLQYEFALPKRILGARVYWFDDTGQGNCRAPASWRLAARAGTEWKPVEPAAGAHCASTLDTFCELRFAAVQTSALRLELQLQEGHSAGVLEWELIEAP